MSTLTQPGADIWIRDDLSIDDALSRTTYLGIGAHQDDLEFMAYEGIAACYESENQWFTGITVTDGRNSSRLGPYANYTDDDMRVVRREEQRKAAELGRYSAQFQLDYQSKDVKVEATEKVIGDLVELMRKMKPTTVYLHQPADKHDAHVAVLARCIEALRRTAEHHIPDRVIGCEVWRGLDWLADSDKVLMDCGAYPELTESLNAVFDSQITGGKRYDLAVQGRRRANATFFDSHGSDLYSSVAWGVELKPLVEDASLSMEAFITDKVAQLSEDIVNRISKFL
jgi:LmbE family N-acetylglucosaminyl deacetylase